MVHPHLTSKSRCSSTFVSNFNIVSMVRLMFRQRMGTKKLLAFSFLTIASIIFENITADIDTECERAFTTVL